MRRKHCALHLATTGFIDTFRVEAVEAYDSPKVYTFLYFSATFFVPVLLFSDAFFCLPGARIAHGQALMLCPFRTRWRLGFTRFGQTPELLETERQPNARSRVESLPLTF
jgi:hypothetical protein